MPKSDIFVHELVNRVKRGELLLPEMQRRYVWPATRVRDLLDSLYRGYPTGTILVWETDEQVVTSGDLGDGVRKTGFGRTRRRSVMHPICQGVTNEG